MSYDIGFVDEDGDSITLETPHQLRGGTYAVGGTPEAWLNITYNYAPHFVRAFKTEEPVETFDKIFGGTKASGIRSLYGMTAAAVIPKLEAATALLTGERDDDYWAPTEGNARAALFDLLALARAVPANAILQGD